MIKIKYMKTIFLILIICVSVGGLTKISLSKTSNLSEIEIGSILSVNITNSEFTNNVDGVSPSIILGDGKVSSLWDDITSVEIESYSKGTLKSGYGSKGVYFLITHPVELSWIGLQWDSDNTGYSNIIPMEIDDDLWIFGNAPKSSSYGDAYSIDQGIEPLMDEQNDLQWEKIIVNDSEGNSLYIAWEIYRNYETNDLVNGKDIQFNDTNSNIAYPVLFASSSHHKQNNLITKANFHFSELALGESPLPTEYTNNDPILVNRFVFAQIFFGLTTGVISMILFLYLPIFIYKRRRL